MRNLLLRIGYDGTQYSGWQFQPQVPTVQGAIEAVLERMTGKLWRVRGGSRTDAGVHADGQIANVRLESRLSCDELFHGMNALLPADIVLHELREVPLEFESRRDNHGKHYRYRIWNARQRNIDHHSHAYHLERPLQLPTMAQAAQLFVGTHDFAAFRAADCDRETTVRTLTRCSIQTDGPLVSIDVEGTAFLKNMVRILVGTLVDVAYERISLAECAALLKGGDRSRAGSTLPAHGLTLIRVYTKLSFPEKQSI